MLKIPPVNVKPPTKMVEDPNMKALFEHLQKVESQPNVITLDAFREFEPLFRKNHNLTEKKINKLTEKYQKFVDYYKETQIILSATNPVVIVTLPSIFTPVRSLESTEKNASLVATNAAMAHNSVPKYSSDAFANMFKALTNEQIKNANVIQEYKARFVACVTKFFETYANNDQPARGLTSSFLHVDEPGTMMGDETTWDVD